MDPQKVKIPSLIILPRKEGKKGEGVGIESNPTLSYSSIPSGDHQGGVDSGHSRRERDGTISDCSLATRRRSTQESSHFLR